MAAVKARSVLEDPLQHSLQNSTATGPTGDIGAQVEENLLVVSAYRSRSHLLDLNSVSLPHQLLARALNVMDSVRANYATAPYIEAFNWGTVIEELKILVQAEQGFEWQDQSFFIVVFRSQIPPTTDRSHLGALDELAHEEATTSGGLLKYWFGKPDESGRNLATCIWRDTADAQVGGIGPGHQRAAKAARTLYTEWKIERLRLRVGAGAENWHIGEWGA